MLQCSYGLKTPTCAGLVKNHPFFEWLKLETCRTKAIRNDYFGCAIIGYTWALSFPVVPANKIVERAIYRAQTIIYVLSSSFPEWVEMTNLEVLLYFTLELGLKQQSFLFQFSQKDAVIQKKHTNKNNFHNALPSFVCLVQNRRHILISWRETSAGKHTIPSHPTQVSAGARFGQVGSPAIGHRVFDVWNMVKPRNMLVSPKRV